MPLIRSQPHRLTDDEVVRASSRSHIRIVDGRLSSDVAPEQSVRSREDVGPLGQVGSGRRLQGGTQLADRLDATGDLLGFAGVSLPDAGLELVESALFVPGEPDALFTAHALQRPDEGTVRIDGAAQLQTPGDRRVRGAPFSELERFPVDGGTRLGAAMLRSLPRRPWFGVTVGGSLPRAAALTHLWTDPGLGLGPERGFLSSFGAGISR